MEPYIKGYGKKLEMSDWNILTLKYQVLYYYSSGQVHLAFFQVVKL